MKDWKKAGWVLVILVIAVFGTAGTLAQSVYVDHADGLFVSGSSGDDEIIVTNWRDAGQLRGVHVTINGGDFGNWPTAERTGITVRGWEGNDVINLKKVTVRVFFLDLHPEFAITVTGDEGDDIVFGSTGNDFIYGNAGDDKLHGRYGNDLIRGGDGDDLITGGRGHDILEGDAGRKDRIYGGCGNDKIADKDGFKLITGGYGEDKIITAFPEGWGRRRAKILAGYDGDYIEITNNDGGALSLAIDGDVPAGYDNEGDTLVTFGNFPEDEIFPHVETVIHN